eukprot:Awhi_evm1s13519
MAKIHFSLTTDYDNYEDIITIALENLENEDRAAVEILYLDWCVATKGLEYCREVYTRYHFYFLIGFWG